MFDLLPKDETGKIMKYDETCLFFQSCNIHIIDREYYKRLNKNDEKMKLLKKVFERIEGYNTVNSENLWNELNLNDFIGVEQFDKVLFYLLKIVYSIYQKNVFPFDEIDRKYIQLLLHFAIEKEEKKKDDDDDDEMDVDEEELIKEKFVYQQMTNDFPPDYLSIFISNNKLSLDEYIKKAKEKYSFDCSKKTSISWNIFVYGRNYKYKKYNINCLNPRCMSGLLVIEGDIDEEEDGDDEKSPSFIITKGKHGHETIEECREKVINNLKTQKYSLKGPNQGVTKRKIDFLILSTKPYSTFIWNNFISDGFIFKNRERNKICLEFFEKNYQFCFENINTSQIYPPIYLGVSGFSLSRGTISTKLSLIPGKYEVFLSCKTSLKLTGRKITKHPFEVVNYNVSIPKISFPNQSDDEENDSGDNNGDEDNNNNNKVLGKRKKKNKDNDDNSANKKKRKLDGEFMLDLFHLIKQNDKENFKIFVGDNIDRVDGITGININILMLFMLYPYDKVDNGFNKQIMIEVLIEKSKELNKYQQLIDHFDNNGNSVKDWSEKYNLNSIIYGNDDDDDDEFELISFEIDKETTTSGIKTSDKDLGKTTNVVIKKLVNNPEKFDGFFLCNIDKRIKDNNPNKIKSTGYDNVLSKKGKLEYTKKNGTINVDGDNNWKRIQYDICETAKLELSLKFRNIKKKKHEFCNVIIGVISIHNPSIFHVIGDLFQDISEININVEEELIRIESKLLQQSIKIQRKSLSPNNIIIWMNNYQQMSYTILEYIIKSSFRKIDIFGNNNDLVKEDKSQTHDHPEVDVELNHFRKIFVELNKEYDSKKPRI